MVEYAKLHVFNNVAADRRSKRKLFAYNVSRIWLANTSNQGTAMPKLPNVVSQSDSKRLTGSASVK
jgi:hypothetical protein